ncbi:MAG: hypothetical protein DHS20C10_09330 [marine bacterium B5-7]|nr:MAG: hypothetical protein DHS20C10_09330 [marine bacterium B5-7]
MPNAGRKLKPNFNSSGAPNVLELLPGLFSKLKTWMRKYHAASTGLYDTLNGWYIDVRENKEGKTRWAKVGVNIRNLGRALGLGIVGVIAAPACVLFDAFFLLARQAYQDARHPETPLNSREQPQKPMSKTFAGTLAVAIFLINLLFVPPLIALGLGVILGAAGLTLGLAGVLSPFYLLIALVIVSKAGYKKFKKNQESKALGSTDAKSVDRYRLEVTLLNPKALVQEYKVGEVCKTTVSSDYQADVNNGFPSNTVTNEMLLAQLKSAEKALSCSEGNDAIFEPPMRGVLSERFNHDALSPNAKSVCNKLFNSEPLARTKENVEAVQELKRNLNP